MYFVTSQYCQLQEVISPNYYTDCLIVLDERMFNWKIIADASIVLREY